MTNRLAGQVRAVQARLQETNHLGVAKARHIPVFKEFSSGELITAYDVNNNRAKDVTKQFLSKIYIIVWMTS